MMDDLQIFDFERDFAGSLRCIPMIVRFKLDLVGVKLTLRQWSRFDHRAREQLVRMSCDTSDEVAAYRIFLILIIESFADAPAKTMKVETHPEWSRVDRVPERVVSQAIERGLDPPNLTLWSSWSSLQRFALFKLTRPGHDNDNFEPALREFRGERVKRRHI
jgi:hypothetical protein